MSRQSWWQAQMAQVTWLRLDGAGLWFGAVPARALARRGAALAACAGRLLRLSQRLAGGLVDRVAHLQRGACSVKQPFECPSLASARWRAPAPQPAPRRRLGGSRSSPAALRLLSIATSAA